MTEPGTEGPRVGLHVGTTTPMDPALVALCERERPRLVGLLALYLGDRAVAEELAQETLIRLVQHWPKVRRHGGP